MNLYSTVHSCICVLENGTCDEGTPFALHTFCSEGNHGLLARHNIIMVQNNNIVILQKCKHTCWLSPCLHASDGELSRICTINTISCNMLKSY